MSAFEALFGRPPQVSADAPGRVNLIGEHTDYNGGFVLPAAMPQRTRVALARRDDEVVRVSSAGADGAIRTYRLGHERREGDWLDYARGITWALRERGDAVRGFDARIASDVPVGSGLASSAALEVGLLRALRAAFALDLDDVALALLGHRAETAFVGARVGVMDQMAASLADERAALFIDTRTLAHERIPLPGGAGLIVIDSGVRHAHAGGEYNARRDECERAAALLGLPQLRDLTLADVPRLGALPEPLGRRARHVVTENARVLAAVAALRAQDVPRLGELFDASHESQARDFEVSTPEIDLLVDLARREPGVCGARLTGGGFGGSVVALAGAGRGAAAARRIAAAYAARTGRAATVLLPR